MSSFWILVFITLLQKQEAIKKYTGILNFLKLRSQEHLLLTNHERGSLFFPKTSVGIRSM